ncbi:M48 family metallopeptidase [Bradymonas sediminis]|uniref:Zn-dependent protease with chaperone function n=1 Tax=Bradymonas sediminis TaxID=1548548 RepID=A0A2Z4FPU0_9DELT|nr:M48 family metallopeptidase [Bradymonas sediminis]AWV90912.1 Zn-dependent protease with chaperone function [Bradymonas sediminis]TDP75351.1 peptidase M48-like protein [Bradymonas sediminis]
MNNFFEHQDIARKNTTRLVVLFGLALLLTIVSLYFVTLFAFKGVQIYVESKGAGGFFDFSADSRYLWWDLKSFLIATTGTIVVVGGGTYLKIRELARGGGSLVCEQLGGKFIDLRTNDPDEQRLINVVQEMAIASGVSVPLLYVLDHEPSINAFAAGFSPNNAAIAVSKGAMQLLTRDELQGVIAHEFSHILNGDMRLNIRMIGILHGILMIGVAGYTLFRLGLGGSKSRTRSKNDGGGVPLIAVGAALIVIGYGGRLIGRVIKSAISRQREYLADASAVQFTRNPAGLAGALKKIGGWPQGSKIKSVNAEEISHMFFGNGVDRSYWFDGLFSTHPPLQDRVRRIDPYFSGAFAIVHPTPAMKRAEQQANQPKHHRHGDPISSVLTGQGLEDLKSGRSKRAAVQAVGDILVAGAVLSDGAGPQRPRPSQAPLNAAAAVDSVGQMSTEHVDRARELLSAIPEPLQARAQDPFGAATIAFALLLDPDHQMRRAQVEVLRRELTPDMFNEAGRSTRDLSQLDPTLRLPLLEVLVPALRSMSRGQYEQFLVIIDHLIEADQKVTVFEFALKKLLRHRLEATHASREDQPYHIATFYSVSPLRPDIAILLSFLADAGSHGNPAEARRAFDLGIAALGRGGDISAHQLPYFSSSERSFEQLDRALDRIAGAANGIKHRIVRATAACVLADDDVTAQEAELLRVMCAVIDVPLPPFLPEPQKVA